MIVETQQYHKPKVYTRHSNMYILSHYRVYWQEFTLWLAILSTSIHTHIIIIPGTEITHTHTLGHDWHPVDTPNLFTQKEQGAYSKVVMWFQPVMPYKFILNSDQLMVLCSDQLIETCDFCSWALILGGHPPPSEHNIWVQIVLT